MREFLAFIIIINIFFILISPKDAGQSYKNIYDELASPWQSEKNNDYLPSLH